MYDRRFIAVARLTAQGVGVDDPELALLLLRLSEIKLPRIANLQIPCSICLDQASEPVALECGHLFCVQCIAQYRQAAGGLLKCPLCRLDSQHETPLKIPNGTRKQYVIQQRRRMELVQKSCDQNIEIINQFDSKQERYFTARCQLDQQILAHQLRIDHLQLQARAKKMRIAALHEKTMLLQEALAELQQQKQ